MQVSLEWLGVSTYRLVVDDLVIFLDAYIDRNPLAPPVGIQVADVQRGPTMYWWDTPTSTTSGAQSASPIKQVRQSSAHTSR